MSAELDFRMDNSAEPKLRFFPTCRFGHQIVLAGTALVGKVSEQAAISGAYQAARNLRKQGYPLELALALIAGRV